MYSRHVMRRGIVFGLALLSTFLFFSRPAAASDLLVASDPPGARVFINEAYRGDTPTTVQLAPGRYRLVLQKQGYRKYGDEISIRPHRRHELHAVMESARGYGKLVIESDPSGSALFVNDRYHDQTPVELVLKPGRYNIRLESKGFAPYLDEVVVAEGRTLQLTAALEAKARYGALTIESEPPGARIYVEDRYYDLTPAVIELQGGEYRIRIEKEGYEPQVKTVSAGRHQNARVPFLLKPIARHGILSVTSTPAGCKVFIDADYFSTTPARIQLPVGPHELKLTRRGYRTYLETIDIQGGEETAREIALAGQTASSGSTGTLRIHSIPTGARVRLWGRVYGNTPLEVDLLPGHYKVSLEMPTEGISYEAVPVFSFHEVDVNAGELNVVWLSMSQLDPSLFLGELHLASTPPAEVFIDGSLYGSTPLTVKLPGGQHTVEFRREGFRPHRETVGIDVGQVTRRRVNLEGRHPDSTVDRLKGRVDIVSQPLSAKVFVDGQYAGRTPLTLDVNPGTYSLEIRHRGYMPYRQDMRIRPGDNSPLTARLRWQGHTDPSRSLKEVIEGIFRED